MSALDDTKSRRWLAGLILFAAVIFAYQPAWNAGFIWDDDVYVTQNRLLVAPDGLKQIWFSLASPSQYFPLVYTSFRLEHAIWGDHAAGYHWVNILLHGINALLVWRLLGRLKIPGAWLGAALFALHPVQVETVAWVTERKNILSLFFYLTSLLAWIEFTDREPPRWRYYGLALVLCALALFSKTTACTLPAALVLALWVQGKSLQVKRWLQIAPFVAMGLGMGCVSIWWEHHHQGTVGEAFNLPLLERFYVAGRAFWFYLGKLVWPSPLMFSYPRWDLSATDGVWIGACLGLAGILMAMRRQMVTAAFAFYAAAIFPMLGFFMLYWFRYTFVADHCQYAACIGPLALAAAMLAGIKNPLVKPVLYGGIVGLLAALTWNQCRNYADSETLWRATLAKNPTASIAHNNLCSALLEQHKYGEALTQCREVLSEHPDDPTANFNYGYILFQKNHIDEAIVYTRKSLTAQPYDPKTHYYLASELLKKQQWPQAEAGFRRAIELKPDYPEAFCNLGFAQLQQGKTNEAAENLHRAIALRPDYALAHNDLGSIYQSLRQWDLALAEFRSAVDTEPEMAEAHFNIGGILLRRGQTNEALAHFQKALQIRPDLARRLPKSLRLKGPGNGP